MNEKPSLSVSVPSLTNNSDFSWKPVSVMLNYEGLGKSDTSNCDSRDISRYNVGHTSTAFATTNARALNRHFSAG